MILFKKIDHIGIAVKNLKSAISLYEMAGFKVSHSEEVIDMNVRVAFLPVGESRFELLEPLAENSAIAKFIKKRGEGIHHICVEVDNIEMALQQLKKQKFRLVDEKPRKGAEGKKVAFVHPASFQGVLLELTTGFNSAEEI